MIYSSIDIQYGYILCGPTDDDYYGAKSDPATDVNHQEKWDSNSRVSEFFCYHFSRVLQIVCLRTAFMNDKNHEKYQGRGDFFIPGGKISGKEILGRYPSALNPTRPLILEPCIRKLS